MASSADPDQTAPLGAMGSGSAEFVQLFVQILGKYEYIDYRLPISLLEKIINKHKLDWQTYLYRF